MKTKQFKPALAALLLLSTLNPMPRRNQVKAGQRLAKGACLIMFSLLSVSTVFAQGSLTPPGVPAPTMKTLAQIEPRTPISSAPYTISAPGSYYLTTNLTVATGDAITIATNGVTLDLNGFTIASTAASATGYGIRLNSGSRDLAIFNGHIVGGVTNNGSGVYSGSGFGYGIYYSGNPPANVLVSRVSVSGCLYHGIYLSTGNSTVVENCTARTVGGYGIYASTIKSCSAADCGGIAIAGDEVSDSRGQSAGSDGIDVTTALNCYGSSSSGYGLDAGQAQNCDGISSSGYGLYAGTAQNCYGYSSSGEGLGATTAQNCYGSSGGSGTGLYAYTALNCYGSSSSGYGLSARTAQNCYGVSYGSSTGLYANYTASGCYGYSSSGTGLYAFIANVCHGETSTGTALSATHNVNSY